MKDLYQYIIEGGASGHMAHPYDYTDYTLRNLKGLIRSLFEGRITDMTEKLDGTNIQATVNPHGSVVFIRNKGDLNSPQGGMSLSDMADKWANNPSVAKTFVTAGETIEKVFALLPNKFFNPDKNTKVVANCECIVAGKTNIMPYASTQVDFHNLWIYKFDGNEWVKDEVTKDGLDKIEKACEKVDGAQITPQVLVKVVDDSQKLLTYYIKKIDWIFKDADCRESNTIEDWKHQRFNQYLKNKHTWIVENLEGYEAVYKRWFDSDKSINIRDIRNMYPEHVDELNELDKSGSKEIVSWCMEPIDTFFAKLGNDVIRLCQGLSNEGNEAAIIDELKQDMDDVVKNVQSGDNVALKDKLSKQLDRLSKLGNQINSTEGIVFSYKGKLQKITGSFAALNQVLGSIKFSR